jgi:hypothetical protein
MTNTPPTLDQLHFEQYLIDATDAYLREHGLVPPSEDTIHRLSTSLAEAGAGFSSHCFGTKRIDFYRHLHIAAQLAGEEG